MPPKLGVEEVAGGAEGLAGGLISVRPRGNASHVTSLWARICLLLLELEVVCDFLRFDALAMTLENEWDVSDSSSDADKSCVCCPCIALLTSSANWCDLARAEVSLASSGISR